MLCNGCAVLTVWHGRVHQVMRDGRGPLVADVVQGVGVLVAEDVSGDDVTCTGRG